jgi:hypothetical protein
MRRHVHGLIDDDLVSEKHLSPALTCLIKTYYPVGLSLFVVVRQDPCLLAGPIVPVKTIT